MTKEIYCSNCGRKFIPQGREHICPSCKAQAAEAAKRAAVERAKARSYSGEACPVRISARARGFIEAVADQKGCKFIPALDEVLKAVCTKYGFEDWQEVPEHKTARRKAQAKVATVTPAEAPATPVKASKPATTSKATASKTKVASKTTGKAASTSKTTGKAASKAASKASASKA